MGEAAASAKETERASRSTESSGASVSVESRPLKRPAERVARPRKKLYGSVLDEADYYFENGLRKVVPYAFEYRSYAKGRWVGEVLLDVFRKEFRDLTPGYYQSAIADGRITVNGQRVGIDYVVRERDLIAHSLTRIEPPVLDEPIREIFRSPELLVVNKPPSIPIHPSGRYRHNSLLYILQHEQPQLGDLYPIHRLDRLTSGVTVIALDKALSQRLQQQMLDGKLVKEYLCRVRGEFPADEVECTQPILVFHHKLGLNTVAPNGKPCRTVFRRLAFNGRTSLVHCRPYTGRTHQIRVHLQYLGFPIANDPLYAHPAWGPLLGRGGVSVLEREEVVRRFYAVQQQGTHDEEASLSVEITSPGGLSGATGEASSTEAPSTGEATSTREASSTGEASPIGEASKNGTSGKLTTSAAPRGHVQRADPTPAQLVMWLHAWRYSGPEWSYEAPAPSWAHHDFADDENVDVQPLWAELAEADEGA